MRIRVLHPIRTDVGGLSHPMISALLSVATATADPLLVTVSLDPPALRRPRVEEPPLEVPVLRGRPARLDADLRDPIWRDAPSPALRPLEAGGPATASTLRVAADEQGAYFAGFGEDGSSHQIVIDATGARQAWDVISVRPSGPTLLRCRMDADPGADGVPLGAARCTAEPARISGVRRGARFEIGVTWAEPPTAALRIGWSERDRQPWVGGTWAAGGDSVMGPDQARRIEGATPGRFILEPNPGRTSVSATLRTEVAGPWEVTAHRLGRVVWRGEVEPGAPFSVELSGRSAWANVVFEARAPGEFMPPAVVTPLARPEVAMWLGSPVANGEIQIGWESDVGWSGMPVRVRVGDTVLAETRIDLPQGSGTLGIAWARGWPERVLVDVPLATGPLAVWR
jgi:hypothetical protein